MVPSYKIDYSLHLFYAFMMYLPFNCFATCRLRIYCKFSCVVANLKKSPPVSGPAEFKPMLFKGQLYNALLLKIIKQ